MAKCAPEDRVIPTGEAALHTVTKSVDSGIRSSTCQGTLEDVLIPLILYSLKGTKHPQYGG